MLQEAALEAVEAERHAALELFDGLDVFGDQLEAARLQHLHGVGEVGVQLARERDLHDVGHLEQAAVAARDEKSPTAMP